MAFEDELGYDPSQPGGRSEDFQLTSTGLLSRTIDLWIKNLLQYILIIGIGSAAFLGLSSLILSVLLETTSVASTDPISFILNTYLLNPESEPAFIALSFGFGCFLFVMNAIFAGAVIKFTLDSYGGIGGDISSSFRHSLSRVVTFIVYQIIISAIVAVITVPALYYTNTAFNLISEIDINNPVFPPGAIEALMMGMVLLLGGSLLLLLIQTKIAPTLAIILDTDLSAIGALKRAWNLTNNNFLHVLAGEILLGIAIAVFTFGVSFGTGMIGLGYSQVLESIIIALLFSSLNYVFMVVLYRDLLAREDTMDYTL